MRLCTFATFLFSCAALAACDGSATGPSPAGVYSLTAPTVLENWSVRIEILEETLTLYDDGTAVRDLRQRISPREGGLPAETRDERWEYTYEIDGASIELAAECGPLALCAPPPHAWGELSGTGLELHVLENPDAVLRYQRVSPPD